MNRREVTFWLSLALCAAALVASAILLVDYIRPAPVFCEAGGGCEKVRMTVFARPLGIPLPAIGLLGTLAIGLALLVPGKPARTAQLALAGVAGIVGASLLIVQARMQTVCPFCAIVDSSSLGLAILSGLRFHWQLDPPPQKATMIGSIAGLVLATGVPLGIGFTRRVYNGDLPLSIKKEMDATGPKKVTVVDFVDFECPFCRMTHAEFGPLLAARKDKVRVARKHVPLRMHPHAMDAAKAGCCGEMMGKGDEMDDALFSAPVEELTPEGCEKIAQAHGLDVDAFRKCVSDPATAERIEADKTAFRAAKGHGLPTIWVDDVKLEGSQDKATLESTLDTAISRL